MRVSVGIALGWRVAVAAPGVPPLSSSLQRSRNKAASCSIFSAPIMLRICWLARARGWCVVPLRSLSFAQFGNLFARRRAESFNLFVGELKLCLQSVAQVSSAKKASRTGSVTGVSLVSRLVEATGDGVATGDAPGVPAFVFDVFDGG